MAARERASISSGSGGSSGPLAGVRVLDLTTRRAELAGRLLSDLGADVLKIEPGEGSSSRLVPPFEGNRAGDIEASLYWAAVALGKKSAVLDIRSGRDRLRFCDLATRSDILLESFDPGTMEALGLGPENLCERNPRLIYVSVTPYGQWGPKAHWPATELTIEAAGGRVALQGDRDRVPLPMGYPQAAFHAGAQAAADAIIALNERELSGRGQWLDTSMQEVMIWTLLGPGWYPAAIGEDYPGVGEDRSKPQLPRSQRLFPALSPCQDGYVVAALGPGAPGTKGVLPFLLEEQALRGELDEELRDIDWANWTEAFRTKEISDDQVRVAVKRAEEILRSRTKRELFEWAVQNDLRLAPVHTTRDLLEDPQLRVRGFFREIEGRLHPSASLRLSRSPTPLRRGAPSLGSNQEVLESWLREPPAPANPAPSGDRPGEAFAGLRVADLSWVVTGPTIGKALADCGATVVRLESSQRIDLLRQLPPFKDGQPGPNRSFWMATYNTSKLSASVNLSTEAGRVLARRIVDWADVVIESFSPGTMRKLGLDYETLTRDRDDLIMLSTSLLGQTGPLASYAGYGQQGVALAGLQAVTGWPDRAPCGPFGPYTDVIAPKYGIAALGAAILERRRSGLGQHIDLSQVESSIHFIEPLVLDESVNGQTAGAAGLDSATACPHGIYATRETERYIAIAVETSEQWRGLCTLAPLAAFSGDAYEDIASRKRVRDEIDRELRAWCVKESCRDLEARLIAAGVPAAVVQRPLDLHEDPQLEHRGFHTLLDHTELGPILLEGFPTRFSAKPEMLRSAAPCLGEHTDYVLRELLHMTPAEIQEFRNANALS